MLELVNPAMEFHGRPARGTATGWLRTTLSDAPLPLWLFLTMYRFQHPAAFGDTSASLSDAGVPDRSLGVGANPVRGGTRTEVSPDPAINQFTRLGG
jgi:hypothetical protein